MKKEAYIGYIVRYLNNQMEKEERIGFEHELDNNQELSSLLNTYVSRVKVKHDLDQMVKQNALDMGAVSSRSTKAFSLILKIAAIALIVLIPSVFLINRYLFSTDTLINETNMRYYGETSRGSDAAEMNSEILAFNLYQNKQYGEAAKQFHLMADTATKATRYELYSGICMLWGGESADMDTAMFYLQRAIQANNQYSRAAQWYYALALYEVGQKEEAKKIFLQFANDSSNFKKSEATHIISDKY
ncbi:MAG: hypothetical protein COW63_05545 [Bacteroidetes bacterium CG18_big_fil_WC_8_21_14_2_50_41_14]|nr:MAG: hypothetical protein COW63_05545 [Bacteroidetes bacterium CG18_big_fil_WC_8_21_14_2_50_41_14]PJB58806.1 MAG: hypothetical protein CO098_06760 [Bacteroidetes bacterium CG_4_9_14_3_um_filter_41_19]